MENQNKNLILATVLSFIVITVWMIFFPPASPDPVDPATVTETTAADGATVPPAADSGMPVTGEAAAPAADPAEVLAESPRIAIDTPALTGTIALTGGRIDDLHLREYHETIDDSSPTVTLLKPAGTDHAYYTLYGWAPAGDLDFADVPGSETPWALESGETLTPETPVTLVWDNGKGLIFRREISVDDKFLFTVRQTVENAGATGTVRLAPYGIIARVGEPEGLSKRVILHEGVIRQTDSELSEVKYKDVVDFDTDAREGAPAETEAVEANGWIGFTDHYWMTTLLPDPGQAFTSVVKYVASADIYQTEVRLPTVEVAQGEVSTATTNFFAGAKEWETIRAYENDKGFYRFVDSIDWGMFFFITKPMFAVLHWLHSFIGNMGWAIIALTFLVKAVLFPLARKSYISMARMKELQPEMEKIKERVGDDRQKVQMETMELYKREKVNPAAGCLPLILQIPIFFSLYKVIFVTLELRHQPWIGWIQDLSAPDPSSILNLFGLLPYAPPGADSFLAIASLGALPILLGVSMWLQQKLNPAPTEPSQAMIMAWMPWVFMFMLGQFASGLVLYWISNNTITFIQQYLIMTLHGSRPDLFGNILKGFKRKPKAEK